MIRRASQSKELGVRRRDRREAHFKLRQSRCLTRCYAGLMKDPALQDFVDSKWLLWFLAEKSSLTSASTFKHSLYRSSIDMYIPAGIRRWSSLSYYVLHNFDTSGDPSRKPFLSNLFVLCSSQRPGSYFLCVSSSLPNLISGNN